uniref:Cell division cycle protein 48 MJ1156 n=1 Tax=Lygus hesperus TaxID=30085 RepID=A0A0A9WHE9_LYGHE
MHPLRGLLIHGPPGVGKSWSVHRAVSDMMSAIQTSLQTVFGPRVVVSGQQQCGGGGGATVCYGMRIVTCSNSLLSSVPGRTEENLRNIFADASGRRSLTYRHLRPIDDRQHSAMFPHYSVCSDCDGSTFDCVYPLTLDLQCVVEHLRTGTYAGAATSVDGSTHVDPATRSDAVVQCTPIATVVIFDEIDSIFPCRKRDVEFVDAASRTVAQMLTLLDGFHSRKVARDACEVIVVGTTNNINQIDMALRRPGRLDREIYLDAPDEENRHKLLE